MPCCLNDTTPYPMVLWRKMRSNRPWAWCRNHEWWSACWEFSAPMLSMYIELSLLFLDQGGKTCTKEDFEDQLRSMMVYVSILGLVPHDFTKFDPSSDKSRSWDLSLDGNPHFVAFSTEISATRRVQKAGKVYSYILNTVYYIAVYCIYYIRVCIYGCVITLNGERIASV